MPCAFLKRKDKPDIAYHHIPANAEGRHLPPVVFLGGFKSDMNGTKATFLEHQCAARGQEFLRFDYTGHGQSGGKFEDGTIGIWKRDALDIMEALALRGVILVGSSMGGWIALRIMLEWPKLAKGMVGLAAAPDFTDDMWFNRLNDEQRAVVERDGFVAIPNEYSDEPYVITKALIDDGRKNFVLTDVYGHELPIVLIQGMEDPDVPWETTNLIKNAFIKADVDIVLVEDGDHRLSRPEDLALIDRELVLLSGRKDGAYNTL